MAGEGDDEIYIALVDVSPDERILLMVEAGIVINSIYQVLVQITAMSKLEMHCNK